MVASKHRSQTFIAIDERLTTNDCLALHYGRIMPIHPSNRESRLLRFGVFEVDLFAGELRKNGARIRLQEQPFQVFAALLRNAGQFVTREALPEKTSPAHPLVCLATSLNT